MLAVIRQLEEATQTVLDDEARRLAMLALWNGATEAGRYLDAAESRAAVCRALGWH